MIIGRTVLNVAAITALAGALALTGMRPGNAEVKEIRMVEAGGKSGESIEKGYIEPFTAKTGIKVIRENPNPLGKLKAMVESGNVTVPLYELGGISTEIANASGLTEPLDWAAIDPDPMFDEAKKPNAFGYQYYSTLMAWRDDAKPLRTWADFWNVKEFPGKRALPDDFTYAIPIALLADGVAPDKLYPLDLDRAFEKLNEIKPHVAVWWTAGAQPPQLLQDNEVQYAASYSGRVAGMPEIDMTFNQGLLDLAYFVVPKGADPADKAAAMKLLHEMSVAENQAKAAEVVSYTGPSPQLDPLLPKDRLAEFPTTAQNKGVQILSQPEWWAENRDTVEKRWLEFKLGM